MVSDEIASEIAKIALKQLQTSEKFKQSRVTEILDTESILAYKLKPTLQGRLNVPFDGVLMNGFIDTFVSQVNLPPKIEFEDPTGANLKGARKTSAMWERDKKRMRLRAKDKAGKRIASYVGRAIYKYYAESDPTYKPNLDLIDYLDFHCEPNGGGHLDDHYFHWQENIFRSKEDLENNGENGWYEKKQVEKVITNYASPDFKKNMDTYANKQSRYASLGLDMESHNYIGGTLYNLVEGDTWYKGKKYHLIWERCTGTWLRCVPLVQDFSNDLTPFISFATPQEDAFNFWNLAPADQFKPVAESIRINLNEVLNNNRKRNWDMKAVDSSMFPDIKKLDWRQDGIVSAKVPLGQSIQNGIYRFETPEISGALNLNNYLNQLVGINTGITDQTKGSSQQDVLGIAKLDQVQISKKTKSISDSYEDFYEDLGYRYDWGLYDHLSEDEMVKLISTDGIGWEKITKEDKEPDYVINIISTSETIVETEEEKKTKLEGLMSIEQDPEQKALINLKAHVEEKYRLFGYDEEKIKKMMNRASDTTDEIISEAKKAIEQILQGKEPKINSSATTGYLQYINDWLLDNSEDITEEQKAKIEAYFDEHEPIAIMNAEKKQFQEQLQAGTTGLPTVEPKMPTALPPETPVPTNMPPTNEFTG